MKIAKYMFLLLLLAITTVSIHTATQEGKFQVEGIKTPKTILYNYMNNYKQSKKWNPSKEDNPQIKHNNYQKKK